MNKIYLLSSYYLLMRLIILIRLSKYPRKRSSRHESWQLVLCIEGVHASFDRQMEFYHSYFDSFAVTLSIICEKLYLLSPHYRVYIYIYIDIYMLLIV